MGVLRRVSTIRYLYAAVLLAAASAACSILRKVAWRYEAQLLSTFLEYAGVVLFGVSYPSIWILLIVGVIRPVDKFTLRGSAGRRSLNFLGALAALALLHLWIAFAIATSGS